MGVVVATEREREPVDRDAIELSRVAIRLLDLADQGAVHRGATSVAPLGARGAAVRSCTSTGDGGRVPEEYTRGPAGGTPEIGPGRLRRARPLASEVVLEADDVVELRASRPPSARSARSPRSDGSGPSAHGGGRRRPSSSTWTSPASSSRYSRSRPLTDEDRLVLDQVALERQPPARLDDEDLADVPIRVRPRSARGPTACRPAGVVPARSPLMPRGPAARRRPASHPGSPPRSPRCRRGRAARCPTPGRAATTRRRART